MTQTLITRPQPTEADKHIASLRRQVRDARQWIDYCGGSQTEYILRYGSNQDPEFIGDGGEAIWNADITVLRAAERRLANALAGCPS